MRNIKLLCNILLLAGVSISGAVLADTRHGSGGHGGHGHGGRSYSGHGQVGIGFYFGGPYVFPFYPSYYYPYPYYYPPVVIAPAPQQPPVYIEQQGQSPSQISPAAEQAMPDNYYWYHCDKPEGYYPYIKECPGGWQKVTPTPPPQP